MSNESRAMIDFRALNPHASSHNLKSVITDSGEPLGDLELPLRAELCEQGSRSHCRDTLTAHDFGLEPLMAVHDLNYLLFLRNASQGLGKELQHPLFAVDAKIKLFPPGQDTVARYRTSQCHHAQDDFTPILTDTWTAAYASAQTALTGAQAIIDGSPCTYAISRPPGHHAASDSFGGFCFINNAAVAAKFLAKDGSKVAILDIDVHHGNGTQEIFYRDPLVSYSSLHGDPALCYPFSGHTHETGEDGGKIFNYPLPNGTKDDRYCETLSYALKDIAALNPRFLVLSLGFDICSNDPYGTFDISDAGLKRIALMVAELNLPTLIVQEGGYNLDKLEYYTSTFLAAFGEAIKPKSDIQ